VRGSKPKPTAKKILEGNPGRRPLNAQEPLLPAATSDDVPPELADDPVASLEWRRLLPLLQRAHAITLGDLGSLIALCQQWSRYQSAHKQVQIDGMVVKSANGYAIPNALIGVSNKALGNCLRLWAELGLTPSSRSRVTTTPGASLPDDPFAEFDQPTGAH